MSDGWYEKAQICTSGHVINWMSALKPEYNRNFCDKCGAPTITNCQYCKAVIRGYYHEGLPAYEDADMVLQEVMGLIPSAMNYNINLIRPSFCPDCGKPYPWTEAALKAAQEYSDELENLSPEERDLLKKSIDDIVRETPQATVAVSSFKRLVAKAGPVAADMYREILLPLLNEAIKRQIWP